MSKLLTGVANALRGDPGPLHRWSWHDLPERAAAAIAAIDVMQKAALASAAAPAPAVPSDETLRAIWKSLAGTDLTIEQSLMDGMRRAYYAAHGIAAPQPTEPT